MNAAGSPGRKLGDQRDAGRTTAGRSPTPWGELLRHHREAAALSQERLAEKAGLSTDAISALERGKRRAPLLETVGLLADALDLTADERRDFLRLARPSRGQDRPSSGPGYLAPVGQNAEPEPVDSVAASRQVYLSYTHADRALVGRLIGDLEARGVAIWRDAENLRAGTPDWEQVVRDAIRAAPAVLLIASAHTRGSRYVADELRVAEMYRRAVCPIWLSGERWMDCVPLGWGGVQYVDARGPAYDAALQEIVRVIEGPSASGVPSVGETSQVPEAQIAAIPRNPYKGLRAFHAADAADFFGRARLIAELVAAVDVAEGAAPRFVAVVGPSGSGKSSVVLAGLLPHLRSGVLPGSARWIYLPPLAPGPHPLEALTIALATALPESGLTPIRADLDASGRGLHLVAARLTSPEPGRRVVLVVDQAEELFTLTADEDERRRFVDLLVTAATEPQGRLLLVLTLRADFFDRPLAYPALGRLMEAHSKAVLPMEIDELRAAIEGPAAPPDAGLHFEGNLVGDLLYEVRGQAGALPLLQFTLDQLFDRRQGHLLTLAAYAVMGGVRGALAGHAEQTFRALPREEHRHLTRALFLRLIEPGATEHDTTRRRAPLAELDLPDPRQTALLQEVVAAFVDARLLTATESGGTTTVEVSHEALLREWDRLAGWLRETREDVRLQHTVGADAAAWARHGRPEDSLYRGTVLADAMAWARRNLPSVREQTFLKAAEQQEQRRAIAEQERQTRELTMAQHAALANRRAATRLRTLVAVLALFLIAAAGLTTLALTNAHQAQLEARQAVMARRQAITARDLALSRQLATQAITHIDSQYDLALLLSLQARRIAPTVEARDSLVRVMEAAPPGLITFLSGHTLGVNQLVINRAGTILVSAGTDGTIRLWDMRRHRALGPPLVNQADSVDAIALSPDGTLLAAGNDDGTVRLWDVARRRPIGPPLPGYSTAVNNVVFSPDGKTLAFTAVDNTIQLWNVARRSPLAISPLAAYSGANSLNYSGTSSLAFSPNGKVLAAGEDNGVIELWNMDGGMLLGNLYGHTNWVWDLAFSPDGKTLASAGFDNTVRLWDVTRRRQLGAPLTGHTDPVYSVAFNRQGTLLASGSLDGTVRLWDVRHRRSEGSPLISHTGEVYSVVFSPDGTTLAAGTTDGTIALWGMRHLGTRGPGALSSTFASGLGTVESVAVSPDGKMLASGNLSGLSGGDMRLWDLARGTPLLTIPDFSGVNSVVFSPNGRMLLVGSADSPEVQMWDTTTGQSLGLPVLGQSSGITSVAFNPDSRTVASGSVDGTILFWGVGQRPRGQLRPLFPSVTSSASWIRDLAFSPDGILLASGGSDDRIHLWDVTRRRQIGPPLVGHTAALLSLAFSPDGKLLASGSNDTTVRIWDVARHRELGPPLLGHTDSVNTVAFSPDGTMLASGGQDNTVRLWDVASGQPLGAPLTGATSWITSLAFTPDGKTLVTGSADGAIRLWNVDLQSWPARACQMANRNMTGQEWREYLGATPYQSTCFGLPVGS